MKTFLYGTVALAACIGASASAADFPTRNYTKAPVAQQAALDWSGFYIGANAGYAATTNCWMAKGSVGAITPESKEGCQQPTGAILGGQVGYNWQFGRWLAGLEAQGDWANVKDTGPSDAFPSDLTDTIHGIGLFTARVGYVWDQSTLLYIKGGAALVREEYHFQNRNIPSINSTARETRLGGAAGVGVEFAINPNWSFALEYNHLFLCKRDMTFDPIYNSPLPAGYQAVTAMDQSQDIFSVKLNYRFGASALARN